jgi:hypothetical protein
MGGDPFVSEALERHPPEEEPVMPSGVFPVPQFQSKPDTTVQRSPGHAARWLRRRLDPELASGADPAASAALTRRADQLRSPEERARIANRLVEFVGDARGANLGAFRTKTRARHAAIRASADDLVALALRLRDQAPITVRGAALIALLVNDPEGPLRHGDGHELADAVQAARVALDPPNRDARDLAAAA